MIEKIWKRLTGWFDRIDRIYHPKVTKILPLSSVVMFAVSSKTKRHIVKTIILPHNFDLDEHIKKFPPNSRNGFDFTYRLNFDKGKVYYILSLLSSIPATNKDYIDEGGWTPLHMGTIKHNIKDATKYMDYLTETSVLEKTNYYIIGETSYKYRWAKPYRDGIPVFREVKCRNKKRKPDDIEGLTNDPNLPEYLAHWYSTKQLLVNPLVSGYSRAIYKAKMNGSIPLDFNKNSGKPKDPQQQYVASLHNILRLSNFAYEAKRDNNVHRLHSVITNMQSDYRNFLSFNDETLGNIDIKNSQPYLACLILNPDFWKEDSQLPLTLYHLPLNIQAMFKEAKEMEEITSFFKRYSHNDFETYIQKVTSGEFYDQFVELANQRFGCYIDRKEAKTMMFNILFSSNRGQVTDPTIKALKELFKIEVYPIIYKLFSIIKHSYNEVERENQHNRLACLLQAIESHIMLDKVCKRIWEEGNKEIPVFTIHDSIATTLSNKSKVRSIMFEELTKAIGYEPTLDEKEWKLDNVEYKHCIPTN